MAITADEIARRWIEANEMGWEAMASHCAGTKRRFETGDVVFCLAHDDGESFYAPEAAMVLMKLHGVGIFRAVGVHIADGYKGVPVEDLPEAVRVKVVEAFTIVDTIAANLSKAYDEAVLGVASKQEPS